MVVVTATAPARDERKSDDGEANDDFRGGRQGVGTIDNSRLTWELGNEPMCPALALGLLLIAGVLGCPTPALADSGDEPLSARLAQVRSDPDLSNDGTVLEDLAARANAAPATPVRAEARMVVAEAWLGRLHRTDDGLEMLRRVADDPAADALIAHLAERDILDALIAKGDISRAAREVRVHESQVDARFAKQVRKLERRVWLRAAALGELILFAALVALALVRAKRRRLLGTAFDAVRGFAPAVVAFSAFVGIGGGLLASQFEAGDSFPFSLLGAAVAPLVVLGRAWSAVGSVSAAARVGRAAVCAASTLAAAFVLLELCSPMYLEGFGL
jgi:hypothetical protein